MEVRPLSLEQAPEEAHKIGKYEGRREVVEELTHYSKGITLAQLGATNRWQARLKGWGMNDGI